MFAVDQENKTVEHGYISCFERRKAVDPEY